MEREDTVTETVPEEPLEQPATGAPDESELDLPAEDEEESGEEAPTEPEPEPEPEPAQPSSYARTQEQDKALTSEQKRHTERVSKILGDEATEVIVCPFCNPELQGFLYPGDLDHPRDEIHAKMIDVLRPAPSVEYVQDAETQTCERCRGEGQTLTGSNVPNYRTKVCSACNGFGYLPPPGSASNGNVPHEPARELVAVAHGEQAQDETDAFGSPRLLNDGRENPNYGRMPQYKDPKYP